MSGSNSSELSNTQQADSDFLVLSEAMTVEELREKLVIALEQRQREGKFDLPPSLLKRIPNEPTDMVPQYIFENKTQIIIPLSTDLRMRNKYNSHLNVLRMGRLMEDIDMCAARTAIEHAQQLTDPETGRFPLVVVTALVDRIVLQQPILPADRDLRLTGFVSWVGRSSVEVTLIVEQQYAHQSLVPTNATLPEHGEVRFEPQARPNKPTESVSTDSQVRWVFVLQARLVMVAQHPVTHRSVPFVPIRARADDPIGQEALKEGERRNAQRRFDAEQSLLKTVPNAEETKLVHSLFLRTVDEHKMTFRQLIKPENAAWISETIVKTSLICHMEERNVYNKIFGGFLMRQALENAWIAVRQFACEYPVLVALDDLVFKHPVEVGSTLFISSTIVYHPAESRHFVVRVTVEVSTIDHSTHLNKQLVTNTAYFVYAIPNARLELRQVFPETYAESMMYLDGKRHYEAVMNEHAAAPSLAASRL